MTFFSGGRFQTICMIQKNVSSWWKSGCLKSAAGRSAAGFTGCPLCAWRCSRSLGAVSAAVGQAQVTAQGMYGSILLHEDAGGYVLVGVVSFATAVVITVLCVKLRERERRGRGTEKGNASKQLEGDNK